MLTLKTIGAIQAGSTVWDDGKGAVAGFGARRQKGAAISYVLKYRTADGRQRWQTIGRHGAPWTPDTARVEARRILAEVAKGSDPAGVKQEARKAPTVADLCREYLAKAESGKLLTRRKTAKKISTLSTDRGRIERHIIPLLGRLKVAAVTRKDVEGFQESVTDGETAARIKTGRHGLARITGGRGTATRTLGLLGAIFTYAINQGLRPDNPCRGIDRAADGARERRLSAEEYAALGKALRSMPESAWPIAIHAARFLAVTGWRRGEMLGLRWSHVDLATRTARLSDTKTGSSMRALSHAACDVLRALPRLGDLVFPSSASPSKPMAGFHKVWLRIAERAALPDDVTPHVLRHSFASIAADLGYSELTIAALIGHKKATITSRYAHHADAVLLAAADAVASKISELMGDAQPAGVVVPLRGSGGPPA
ncbi:MAG: site-specific integrase [Methylocystis sp.]